MKAQKQIGDRLSAIIEHYGDSVYGAAKKLGHDRPTKLYNFIGHKFKPGFDTLVEVLQTYPEVEPGWLVLGEGEMLKQPATEPAPAARKERPAATSPLRHLHAPAVVTLNAAGEEGIMLVPTPAEAGYMLAREKPALLKEMGLELLGLPQFSGKSHRAFMVEGSSMEPTLWTSDVVISRCVDDWRMVKPRHVYVVVTDESLMVKRIPRPIGDQDEEVELLSDNSFFSPHIIPRESIGEIWEVRGVLTTRVPANREEAFERVAGLLEVMVRDSADVRGRLLDMMERLETSSAETQLRLR
ncbi:LexA family transcriptional regulator [Hymenobacter psychrophilus]|uniref:Phage repressor protein C, contains Cro/C1-type HTH and peptisase s24 domains n=1 Tax=Hymenobacter psychrophilus TaxID=651662 RepID=A0A1H3IP69_9BACT|nr:LexA family transcriptional regulator [Hymenobacter psychrophilus]SDY29491.1 Phage repressor protein C, contains Cro/C1-type HTH and peptisase s24 domains [Hymenobacter psychrophilus]